MNETLRKKRGLLVAVSTNLAIVTGFTASSIVSLIVIAAYGGTASDGIWRICFGIGIIVSPSIVYIEPLLTSTAPFDHFLLPHASFGLQPIPKALHQA